MAEKMKPSGIDWIGDIPNEWDITKVKYRTSQIGSGTTPDSGNPLYYEDGCFPWIQSGDLYNADYIRDTEKKITELAVADFNALTWYEKEFVVIAMYGASVGNIAISQISSYTNQACCVLKAKDDDLRYLFFFLSAGKENMLQMAFGGTQPNISQAIIKNLPYLNVSHNEQQAIADFLDKECAQIDSIAADLEKQIALLQQYKKSLITETVTKGLDKSVPMKDSGIEGVGKIPSHWKVNRLKYAAVVKTGPFGTQLSASEYSDEGIPVINVKNIGYGTIIEDDLDYVPDEVCQRLTQHQLQLGDIVFGRKGAVDKHAIITESQIGWVQGSDCIRVRIDGDIESRYLNYLFDTVYFAEYVLLYAVGTTMASINSDILTNSKILVPPITEQRCIADFLDSNCKTLFEIIENKQSQLTTLQQHKKSLIYEYVTGKKRVKEVQ